MNLTIIGLGKVGETLVENFIKEKHDLIVVDTNPRTVETIVNRYDVRGVVGNGLERDVLNDAGVENADFFIACTSRDEVNILCCVLARKLGAKRTIARVRDPEYFKEVEGMKEVLGLDYAFNPELHTAKEIFQVLQIPFARNVEAFGKNKAKMAEFEITEKNLKKFGLGDKVTLINDNGANALKDIDNIDIAIVAYQDDGESFNYENGEFNLYYIENNNNQLSITLDNHGYNRTYNFIKIIKNKKEILLPLIDGMIINLNKI